MPGDRRPVRLLDWDESPDGRVDVLRPKFGPGRLGRWLSARLSRPHLRVRLDEIGIHQVVITDPAGKHTVDQIARALRERQGAGADDLGARLESFLELMIRRGMIGWR